MQKKKFSISVTFLALECFYFLGRMMLLRSEEIASVFEENYPNLCRFLESIVGRGSYAHDIAQESFLRLCQAELGEVSAAEIRFWLFRVARNLALNEISKGKTRAKFWEQLVGFFSGTKSSPEDSLVENERRKIVRELLNQLPEHQRSALLLREEEEMSYREIAVVLDVSENKVKIDIFRARQALRALWFGRQENKQRF